MRSGPLHRTRTLRTRKRQVAPGRIFLAIGGGIPGKLSNGTSVSYFVPSGAFRTNPALNTHKETVTGRLDRLCSVNRTVRARPTWTPALTDVVQLTRP